MEAMQLASTHANWCDNEGPNSPLVAGVEKGQGEQQRHLWGHKCFSWCHISYNTVATFKDSKSNLMRKQDQQIKQLLNYLKLQQ